MQLLLRHFRLLDALAEQLLFAPVRRYLLLQKHDVRVELRDRLDRRRHLPRKHGLPAAHRAHDLGTLVASAGLRAVGVPLSAPRHLHLRLMERRLEALLEPRGKVITALRVCKLRRAEKGPKRRRRGPLVAVSQWTRVLGGTAAASTPRAVSGLSRAVCVGLCLELREVVALARDLHVHAIWRHQVRQHPAACALVVPPRHPAP